MYTCEKQFYILIRNYLNGCAERYIRIQKLHKVSKNTVKQSYSNTVLLPQTTFPVRVSGKKQIELDDYLNEKYNVSKLYTWQRENLRGPEYILHDGPPYANGLPHMGHAINKILKDVTLRSKVIKGQMVHYVPGWDCHGLPIELKALGHNNQIVANLSALEVRYKAHKYAREAVAKQREVFKSWGLLADWNESGCYYTNTTSYIKNQLLQFINLYEKKLIYRDFKPVYWSPSSETALAEAELEYKDDHKSKCATVRLLVDNLPPTLKSFEGRSLYALTWTTTPWTLIANQALAFSDTSQYCVAEDEHGNLYILAVGLLESVQSKIGTLKSLKVILGTELHGATYQHPITRQSLPFLAASHVTANLGTGLVHTAPAHGPEDFLVALKNDIPTLVMVDEKGRYNDAAGAEFSGLSVLKDGCEKVLQKIGADVLHTEILTHSYPYDWRTKEPVIFRASHQWFIDINLIKDRVLSTVSNVQIYPKHNQSSFMNGLIAHVKNRPYWCISRQRAWGTPIPVFYSKSTGMPIVNRKWVEYLCQMIEQHGSDCWWELPIEKLVRCDVLRELNVDISDLKKGDDIMDIWFDSGVSWSIVLPNGKADLYIEGLDQFSGWFQSSMLTSVALQDCTPYKALFVHGFAVDEKAVKMSKSVGNIIDPEQITKGGNDLNKNPVYGVNVLRWWVANHGCQHTQVPVTQELLFASKESVQRLRSVFRFLLGVIHPYESEITIKPEYMHLDKYMLHRLYRYHVQVQDFYDELQFHHVCKALLNFVANDVSSVYCHLIKDRVYCDEAISVHRLAAIEVAEKILMVLVRSVAPILPHLAEEVWSYHPSNLTSSSLFCDSYTVPNTWEDTQSEERIYTALQVKSEVSKLSGTHNTWKLQGVINVSDPIYSTLRILQENEQSSTSELCDILQLSAVTLLRDNSLTQTKVILHHVEADLCKRCRRYHQIQQSELCERCIKVIDNSKMASASI